MVMKSQQTIGSGDIEIHQFCNEFWKVTMACLISAFSFSHCSWLSMPVLLIPALMLMSSTVLMLVSMPVLIVLLMSVLMLVVSPNTGVEMTSACFTEVEAL